MADQAGCPGLGGPPVLGPVGARSDGETWGNPCGASWLPQGGQAGRDTSPVVPELREGPGVKSAHAAADAGLHFLSAQPPLSCACFASCKQTVLGWTLGTKSGVEQLVIIRFVIILVIMMRAVMNV